MGLEHTLAFPDLVGLMKMVSEASGNDALSDDELAVVLLKYYSDIVLPLVYDLSHYQPNRRTYSTLTDEDNDNILSANRISWKGDIMYNKAALRNCQHENLTDRAMEYE
jgi:hypothetical protein